MLPQGNQLFISYWEHTIADDCVVSKVITKTDGKGYSLDKKYRMNAFVGRQD